MMMEGKEVALFNVDGAYYAVGGRCPHRSGPLAKGKIERVPGTVSVPGTVLRFKVSPKLPAKAISAAAIPRPPSEQSCAETTSPSAIAFETARKSCGPFFRST